MAAPVDLVRAALPAVPGVNQLPGIRKRSGEFAGLARSRPPVTVTRAQAEAFAEVCGFPVKDSVPLPYPHLLAFPLHLALMSDRAFPVPAMGMVHLENTITQHRPIGVGERLAVAVRVDPGIRHPAGTAYAFHTEVRSGDATGDVVWDELSTYLRRGVRHPDASWPAALDEVPPTGPIWRLPPDLGRRYARVAGDYNPIHLTALSAKALGFRRQIAHGMWTMARSVAALENRLAPAVRVEVAFKKPVFLPSTVAFGSQRVPGGYAFALHRRGADTVHLLGRTTNL